MNKSVDARAGGNGKGLDVPEVGMSRENVDNFQLFIRS